MSGHSQTNNAFFGPEEIDNSCVLNRDGIYYIRLNGKSGEPPYLVALHGISTEGQAAQALQAFKRVPPLDA